jgi:hypothetical protein
MRLRSVVLLAMAVALLLAATAVVAAASEKTGVTIKLRGPGDVAEGATLKLTATFKNSLKYGGGDRVAVLLQNKDGHLRRIASRTIDWRLGGSEGKAVFSISDPTPTAMGVAQYRVKWTNPGGDTYSNAWRVEIE